MCIRDRPNVNNQIEMPNDKKKKSKRRIRVPRAVRDKVNNIFHQYSSNPGHKLSPNKSRMFVRDLALSHMQTCNSEKLQHLMTIVDK